MSHEDDIAAILKEADRQPKPPAAALIELIRRTPKPQTATTPPGKPCEVNRHD